MRWKRTLPKRGYPHGRIQGDAVHIGAFEFDPATPVWAWPNAADPVDVDGRDGATPIDARLVVGELINRVFSDPETGVLSAPDADTPFLDVNNNGLLDPSDALAVLTALPTGTAAQAVARPVGEVRAATVDHVVALAPSVQPLREIRPSAWWLDEIDD